MANDTHRKTIRYYYDYWTLNARISEINAPTR